MITLSTRLGSCGVYRSQFCMDVRLFSEITCERNEAPFVCCAYVGPKYRFHRHPDRLLVKGSAVRPAF
jgi:hypothetical protein